ncbi:IS3 family transposase, partial [Mammaliicoccus sciuri]|uniref:IS3 family transposase n=1 Tax=Mammaliicoccus sciuri TaxID=1296 RepID=UPI002DB68BA2
NAVAETIFKAVKTEFINTTRFYTIEQLEIELKMYINWYNNERLHAGLNYQRECKINCVSRERTTLLHSLFFI